MSQRTEAPNTVYYGPCSKCETVHGGWEACPDTSARRLVAALKRIAIVGESACALTPPESCPHCIAEAALTTTAPAGREEG